MNTRESFAKGAVQGVELGIHGGSRVIEGIHDAVLTSVGRAAPMPASVPVLSRAVYRAIRGVASLAGTGGTRALDALGPSGGTLTPWQLHCISGFNAAWGDSFHEHRHPWTIPMGFARPGDPASFASPLPGEWPEDPSPHLVIFIHGLGMNELAWQGEDEGYARRLTEMFNCQPLMLRYNTGLPIHDNGETLAHRLEQLVTHYPVPVESLTLVGHSMGGLIGLSAGHYGLQADHQWTRVLRGQCCLGSPHQGAKLETAGNWFTHLLSHTSYSAPLAIVGQWRSAGIKDLRYGSLRADDWVERDRNDVAHFHPHPVDPVPQTHHLIIGTTLGGVRSGALEKTLGDGMVTPWSALNPRLNDPDEHRIERKRLDGIGHMGLLDHPTVGDALTDWYARRVSA